MTHSRFQQGLAARQVLLQVCRECGQHHALERFSCPDCHSRALEWRAASGRAWVHAVTEIHRAPAQSFKALVPYTIVLARLEEGPLVMGHADTGLVIGEPVRASFRSHEEGVLLYFVRQCARRNSLLSNPF
ncbi:DNA-binding protein [Comamonadaceae bacterium OH2310_COT-174]|nr:DNA-binding protein [Comamonadaceae bacterium OH2310_COT-174]